MRIIFFTDCCFPIINGVSTAVDTLAYGLKKRGHEIMVVAPQGGTYDSRWGYFPGNKLLRVPAIKSIIPEIPLSIPTYSVQKKIWDFKPDVIHTHTPFTLGVLGLGMAKFMSCPAITTHHTNFTDPDIVRELPIPPGIARPVPVVLEKIIPKFLKAHRTVIVSTEDTKSDLVRLGVKKEKIKVSALPIMERPIYKSRQAGMELRSRLGIKQGLLFVGRLSGIKHVDEFLRVGAELIKKVPDLKIVIVGEGAEKSKLEKMAVELSVSNRVIWLGAVRHKTLIEEGYYYLGDVFLTMSLFETQGLTTVEAMAAGLVIAAIKSRGSKEIAENVGLTFKRSTDIVSIAGELEKVFKNSKLMKYYQNQSLEGAKKYYLDESIKTLEKIYTQALE